MSNCTIYFEVHITIDPIFDNERSEVHSIGMRYGFRLADLLMKKRSEESEARSNKDAFLTARGNDYLGLIHKTISLVQELTDNGYRVRRYKIEDTVLDSKIEDVLGLIRNE